MDGNTIAFLVVSGGIGALAISSAIISHLDRQKHERESLQQENIHRHARMVSDVDVAAIATALRVLPVGNSIIIPMEILYVVMQGSLPNGVSPQALLELIHSPARQTILTTQWAGATYSLDRREGIASTSVVIEKLRSGVVQKPEVPVTGEAHVTPVCNRRDFRLEFRNLQ